MWLNGRDCERLAERTVVGGRQDDQKVLRGSRLSTIHRWGGRQGEQAALGGIGVVGRLAEQSGVVQKGFGSSRS